MTGVKVAVIVVVVVVAVLALITFSARRAGFSGLGGDTIVRCRSGHIFTTIWIPGASLKSVRLGMTRFQFCPVGRHWTTVAPVNDADLTDTDRLKAASHHDVRIP